MHTQYVMELDLDEIINIFARKHHEEWYGLTFSAKSHELMN